MKVLVTGSRGLVGSACVEEMKNIPGLDILGCSRKDCDLENQSATHDYITKVKPKILVHCAGRVFGIGGNMKDQYLSWRDNAVINMNVIEGARIAETEHIIFMGTGCVYPHQIVPGGYTEEMLWNGNVDASEYGYAHSKRHSLAGLQCLNETYGTGFTYIVSCNLFGPNDSFNLETGHVIPSLIAKFDSHKNGESEKVAVWGDGSAVRDFLSSFQMAKAIKHIALKGPLGIVNVCSGKQRSIREVVESLSNISNTEDNRIAWDATKPNGQAQRYYKNDKLLSTGFAIQDTFYEDLEKTYNWYLSNRSIIRK